MQDAWQVYEQVASEWARNRHRFAGEDTYLEKIRSKLGDSARVLDLGCGAGEPIARFFIERRHALTGVDAAPAMIELCRRRFPEAEWIRHDMRTLALNYRFDVVIAWDSFFHLHPDDQRAMFAIFQRHIAEAGQLIFTSGPKASVAIGELYGHELYHASLDPAEYRSLLDEHGFEVILYRAEDPKCGLHTIWLAQYRA